MKELSNEKVLSLIIPVYKEEATIRDTVQAFHEHLSKNKIPHEILIIYDKSPDKTEEVLKQLENEIKEMRYINNDLPKGFGYAIIKGLNNFRGDYAAIVMGDLSDSPEDLLSYYKKIQEGYDCVFGSRFIKGGKVIDYPIHKLILNRILNNIIRLLFWIDYNDTTNAFKMYSRKTVRGLEPFLSRHFNLTVELPLKAIVRGYSFAVVPNSWTNRKMGVSKLKIKEMGSRYFFIILYCLLEKWLSLGDYRK
jgi:dolichol-phosphate mannosyltransferase